ncbi:CO dehydrogenase/acetyl-CoA synthase delta subunit, TIM barrel [Desulfosarcina cetonica]|nr:CO dehydrogenase/acetyl-CoA synthase delta subunit, TIM barrel [Desulfosarcina cetonica]
MPISDFPMAGSKTSVCCGVSSAVAHAPHEKPGYRLLDFVVNFMETPAGSVPQVRTEVTRADRRATIGCRLGIGRDRYRIAPGIYATGKPVADSPVLVTANYKLSFDVLRSHLAGIHAWILVVETNGINVWCAAGKGSFSADEVAKQVVAVGLDKLVTHRRLILPQLAATGVAARQVKKQCGFEVVWGPVHARDIIAFLDGGLQASDAMRRVTFNLAERMKLIPVELTHLGKTTLIVLPALLLLSGISPGLFSIHAALTRGMLAFLAYLLAIVAGTVLAPALLPWLPGRAFSIKGVAIGMAASALLAIRTTGQLTKTEMLALALFIMALSSYLAMNFTGSTPFTSPTGVEKEMRRAIPAQAAGGLIAAVLWVSAGFL